MVDTDGEEVYVKNGVQHKIAQNGDGKKYMKAIQQNTGHNKLRKPTLSIEQQNALAREQANFVKQSSPLAAVLSAKITR